MRSIPITLLTIILVLGFAAAASAANTPAGTSITNTATAAYKVGAANLTKSSNTLTIKVAEVINVTLSTPDGGNIPVAPGSTDQYLTFLVSNTGNGSETFTFAVNNGAGGDQFDPTLVRIYADNNGDGQYTPGIDQPIPGGTLLMASGDIVKVFVVSNIPTTSDGSTPLVDGDFGNIIATVTSATGTGAKGTVFSGGGDGGVDAILGVPTGLPLSSTSTYTITSISVDINKTAILITHPEYGGQPVPGATITYSLLVTVTGTGTANALTITDPIPANTTYKTGTLTLAGVPLTDAALDDAGEATGSPVNLITVRLGDMAAGTKTITFAVTID